MTIYLPYEFSNEHKDAHLSKIEQNQEIINALFEWVKNPKNILFFCGNVGTGKSYFCSAFKNHIKEKKLNIRDYSEQYFFSELKQTIQMDWDPLRRIKDICECEYVILDDMGSSKMTEWQKEMLSEFIDLRYSSGLPTLITSNLDRSGIRNEFTPRFYSRLFAEKNVIIEQDGHDRRHPS